VDAGSIEEGETTASHKALYEGLLNRWRAMPQLGRLPCPRMELVELVPLPWEPACAR